MPLAASPTLDLSIVRRRGNDLTEWLPPGRPYWLGMGRQAIFAALHLLGVSRSRAVLLPAYQCPSALDPFVAFGLKPLFYDLRAGLEPDLDQVEDMIRIHRPQVVMLIHYFGFPVRALGSFEYLRDRYGFLLIEDCAHSLFSRSNGQPLGSRGDASVFSFSKTLPVPSGGLLVIAEGKQTGPPSRLHRPAGQWPGILRMIVYQLERLAPISLRTVVRAIPAVDAAVRKRMEAPDNGQDLCTPRAVPGFVRWIVERCVPEEIVRRRRANYQAVSRLFEEVGGPLQPMFSHLPEGVSPLGYPILVTSRRDELQQRLWSRGMPVRALWDRLPVQVQLQRFPHAAHLSAHCLTLPVHQSLSPEEAVRVARVTLREAERVGRG